LLEPFSVAVIVAVCADVTDETVAVNPTVDFPAFTYTLLGTETALLLLDTLTAISLAVFAPRYTEQASAPAPLKALELQEILLNR